MAKVSFSLRRNPSEPSEQVGVGSFNRGTPEIQISAGAVPPGIDEDAALKSSGIITSVPTTVTSTFQANAVAYNTVSLEWVLSEPFVSVTDIASEQTGLLGVVLVYSKTGYPETVLDGEMLLPEAGSFYGTESVYTHQETVTIQTDLGPISYLVPEEGRWAYYSLFGYYNENGILGTYFYNKLASIEVLLPKDYGSTKSLWDRIPKYYRELDLSVNNQLFKYITIFGFELDRTRTLLDAVMTQYDPLLAESEAIEQLATQLGLEINVSDLGVTRTRALLHDIGYLRRKKGTIESIVGYITAIGGSEVDVITNGAAPFYEFKVHAQRANLVANPRFVGNLNWSVASQNSVTVDSSATEGITITAGGTGTLVAVRSSVGVPAKDTTEYYTSMSITGDYQEVFEPVWHTSASWASWGSVTSVTEIEIEDNRYAYAMNGPATTGTRYPVFIIELAAGESVTLNKWMVEPHKYGSFFDGDSVFGGYLYQNQSTDYLWENSSEPRNCYSTYTANRQPTQDAIMRVLPKIIPVTLLGDSPTKYTIDFDWVPGKV